ncbi:MAG: glycosyl hydrolase family 18 protein [Acholeplasmataceae bacterium]|jgi:chitinase|nr:glycosyl hydrolase family 18 protein [Acholeplasmataceae bacterium]
MKRLILWIAIPILMLALYACDNQKDPNYLGSIHLTFLSETLTFTADHEHVTVEVVDLNDELQITLSTIDPTFIDAKTIIYVNDERIPSQDITYQDGSLVFSYEHPDPIDLESYVDVTVTLDPNGGTWDQDTFDTLDPHDELTVTALNDLSGLTFSLFDNEQTLLRWYYKLFISYDEDYDAYRVVYADASTASVSNLELPPYDYILGVHLHTEDIKAKDLIIELTQDTYPMIYLRFDMELSVYTSGDLNVTIWTDEEVMGEIEKVYRDVEVLPIPHKENFIFLGWSDGENIHHLFPRYQAKDQIQTIQYQAVWGSLSLLELQNYLTSLIPSVTTGNLIFPTTYSGFELSWESSHPDVIQSDGTYKKPYQMSLVTLTVVATIDDTAETLYFETEVTGYKSLEGPIASSYIYRNFSSVNTSFFETLDIINGAFIKAEADGTLTGSAFLSNMQTYILPKAREYGNWVIPSIAPESAWSTIASSSTTVNRFADEIVNLINTYGFDGVDIDWETPTDGEKTRYTALMKVVYEKVKANNPNHLVTTAITGGQWQPPRYDLLNSLPYIDYINMMTYGMVSSGAQYQNALYAASSYHNTTWNIGKTLTSCSIDESVKIFNNTFQVPSSKIIAGVAFYGIRQTRTYTTSWSSWQNAGSVHYSDIANIYMKDNSYTYAYDERAGVPYLYKNDGSEFISYDNRRSIIEKSEYIIEQGLAGMMYWENGLDTTGALLDAMRTGLEK